MRNGYTLVEILIVMAIIVILSVVSLASFVNRRNQSQLTTTTSEIAGLLREAQSRSVAQASSTAWGVHFGNPASSTPFFALFSGSYATSSTLGYYPLPAWVAYSTTTLPIGSSAEITFRQISGAAAGSSSIALYLIQNPQTSSTISVSPAGGVSY